MSSHWCAIAHSAYTHVYPRARGGTCIIPSVLSLEAVAPLANIRAVTTPWRRNHTALAPRAARSGAAKVGRSTVTAGCTAEAYANRLDFARMAFLFVVKNGACEPLVSAPTHFYASDHACDFPRGSRARPHTWRLRARDHPPRCALSSFFLPGPSWNIRVFFRRRYTCSYICGK